MSGTMAKMSTRPPTITINVTRSEYDLIHQFAHRSGASVSDVMLVGALRLIVQIERGEVMQGVLTEYATGLPPGNC